MTDYLINIYCPSTSKSYDFWIPKTMKISDCIDQLCDSICEFENNQNIFKDRNALFLCSYLEKSVLTSGLTLDAAGVRSGDRLAIV